MPMPRVRFHSLDGRVVVHCMYVAPCVSLIDDPIYFSMQGDMPLSKGQSAGEVCSVGRVPGRPASVQPARFLYPSKEGSCLPCRWGLGTPQADVLTIHWTERQHG